jgi:hypothetical protein
MFFTDAIDARAGHPACRFDASVLALLSAVARG